MDGARAGVAVRPSHHPSGLALDRPRAGQETSPARQALSGSGSYVPGLEGVVASQTAISMVDGENGRLVYEGYVIADLAEEMSFEEVAFLLWEGRLPNGSELDALSLELAGHRTLTQAANIALDALPKDTDPMDVLRSVVSVQGVEHRLSKPSVPLAIHAPAAVIEQLELIGTADNAERWMRDARRRKVKFMGFGHRVYRVYDPRAKILKEMCRRMNPKFYELATRVEEVALQILHEEHPERPQSTNVEFYSAGVLQAIGLPKEYFTPTFAVSRVAGWSAHVLERGANNRIIRPQSEYIGPEPRKPVPLAERA